MTQPFYDRLRTYFASIGAVLRGESEAASVFPNSTDVGQARERLYAEFLRLHLPSSCNVLLGGFLFGLGGDESRQMDIIVTTDLTPQFNFLNPDGAGKSFACLEGAVAAVSIKSTLDSAGLVDSLDCIASIPRHQPECVEVSPSISGLQYEEFPYKVVFGLRGISLASAMATLNAYYGERPDIPQNLRPHLIHLAGQWCIARVGPGPGKTRDGRELPENSFHPMPEKTDVFALTHVIKHIQSMVVGSHHILIDYNSIRDRIPL